METQNELYPIFLKVDVLNVLIVGGGEVAEEKLTFLLKSSPNANVTVLSPQFNNAVVKLASKHQVKLIKSLYYKEYLTNRHLVIAATNDKVVNYTIYQDAKQKNLLINVADTPKLCDFYLGGIVTKGNVKIAISTNGTSPTLAKRLRQLLEEVIPDDIDTLAQNLNNYRKKLKGDFKNKVEQLNELTKGFIYN